MDSFSEKSKSSKIEDNINSENPPPKKTSNFLDVIWPISKSELPKFGLLTLLMFCILGMQNLIRAMKDSVVNTLIGTEIISFLKFWGVLPAVFIFTIIYMKLVNVMRAEKIFYLMMSIFVAFFTLFAFYLFPNHESIHLNQATVDNLITNYPNFKWFILLVSKWSFSLFYIIAELWPSIMYALIFWQFVNKITSVSESKRFYPVFSIFGQTGLIMAGIFLQNISYVNSFFIDLLELSGEKNVITLQVVISIVSALGVIGTLCFLILNKFILKSGEAQNVKLKVKKSSLSLKESIQMVLQSRYIRLITVLLFCYGLAINLVEGPWKKNAQELYPTMEEFSSFVGGYLKYTGIFTIAFGFVGSNMVRHLGWLPTAIISPIMMLVTGMSFFLVANFTSFSALAMMYFTFTNPIALATIIGAVQNVLSKSTKYSLFDSTKEMSYVPLDDELKTKGKAAAEMIGTKMGKAGSALLQSLIFTLLPSATYTTISPFLMCVFLVVCVVWLWAVVELSKEYKLACKKNKKIN